jgi:hypothetical protein
MQFMSNRPPAGISAPHGSFAAVLLHGQIA